MPKLSKFKRESGIVSGASRHVNRIDTIQRIYESNQLVVDPHTADGIYVGERFLKTIFHDMPRNGITHQV